VVSALSQRPLRNDVAMTGEITISGRVLPIGGLKEKVLGAIRAGITHVVIPEENEPDLEDLPEDVRRKIEVTPVATLAEALAVTLRDTTLRDGRLLFGASRVGDAARLAH
jgi:ATP-dependent Lon protease